MKHLSTQTGLEQEMRHADGGGGEASFKPVLDP